MVAGCRRGRRRRGTLEVPGQPVSGRRVALPSDTSRSATVVAPSRAVYGAPGDAAAVCAGAGVERIARVGVDHLSTGSWRGAWTDHDGAAAGGARAEHRGADRVGAPVDLGGARRLAAARGPAAAHRRPRVVLRVSGTRADRALFPGVVVRAAG